MRQDNDSTSAADTREMLRWINSIHSEFYGRTASSTISTNRINPLDAYMQDIRITLPPTEGNQTMYDEDDDVATDSATPTPRARVKDALVRQMGIELTMMSPLLSGKPHDDTDTSIASDYARLVDRLLRRDKVKYNDCSRDIRCVEVSSEILKTWTEVEKFYKSVSDIMLKCGLQPHVDKLISGGGHIHVGNIKAPLAAAMFREVQNRPWLNWIMNEPDDHNTFSYATNLESIDDALLKASAEINCSPSLFTSSLSDDAEIALTFNGPIEYVQAGWFPDTKAKMVRWCNNYDTFEFRFLRAPLHWEEQKAHIKFVEAFIKYVEKKVKDKVKIVTVVDSLEKVKAFTEEQSKAEFLAFLTELGLEHEPYLEMIEDNLADRFKRGTRK